MSDRQIVLVGGAGYVGAALTQRLLEKKKRVCVLDNFWFWKSPEEFSQSVSSGTGELEVHRVDIRDRKSVFELMEGRETVLQLACISNDPSSELDSKFTEEVNWLGNKNVIDAAKASGVNDFIYASSSSVYGVKSEPDVTEDVLCEPITQYSELKLRVEEYLKAQAGRDFRTVAIRPSTVCGFSKRQRLDVIVNILVKSAIVDSRIRVFGGSQLRPNIHIDDMCRLYEKLFEVDLASLNNESFNAGWENLAVNEIAKMVQSYFPGIEIEVQDTDDIRSYHVCSDKLSKALDFYPEKSVQDAVLELKTAFQHGLISQPNSSRYYNVRRMKEVLGLE